ncbi:hypothetical protein [Natrialba swarupiae]|uniref:PRC-barrel domain containing protein n=1 Tax=Natrialba swarupiae TaxID=2448032 RepID=A0A5D5AKK8_9EURY|nr:hypothetical protein [Natrialba swarupiae]TYT61485.1 hypothetical protein FYC77_13285 [Natrialba swarupiae]
MCATFSEDDQGKTVENARGDSVGTIAAVEGTVAYVRPKQGMLDTIKSTIGWDSRTEKSIPLTADSVTAISDEAVRLEGALEDTKPDGTNAGTDDETGVDRTNPAGEPGGQDETEHSDGRSGESDSNDSSTESEEAHDRGLEADPTELTDDDSGLEVHPDDRNDAAVDSTDEKE